LFVDLLTAWYLLSSREGLTIYLHTKKAPFLVSDALRKDVEGILKAFVEDQDSYLSQVGMN